MRQQPKETKTDISSDDAPTPAILSQHYKPEKDGYETAWERMMEEFHSQNPDPPLDMLGRKRKKDYIPAHDDLGTASPEPWEDQGDGKDAFGNTPEDTEDYYEWCSELGLRSLEKPVSAKTTTTTTTEITPTNILVFKDHKLEFPELHLRIAVLGPPEDTRGFPELFSRAYCEGAETLADADLAVFTGGPDVDPAYYGEAPVPSYYGNDERDYEDMAHYMTCLEEGIPMLGICRGAQFLAVVNGAKLVQDQDNHQTDHPMWDIRQKMMLENVSSRHHQSVVPCMGMEVLATSHASTSKWMNPSTRYDKTVLKGDFPPDVEAYFVRSTCSIGIQGHPEYKRYNAFAKWTLDLLNELIILNPDIDWVGERRRLRPELLREQKHVDQNKRETLTAKVKEG